MHSRATNVLIAAILLFALTGCSSPTDSAAAQAAPRACSVAVRTLSDAVVNAARSKAKLASALTAVSHIDPSASDWYELGSQTQIFTFDYLSVAAADKTLAGMTTAGYSEGLRNSADWMTLSARASTTVGGSATIMTKHPGQGLAAFSESVNNFSDASKHADSALHSANVMWTEKGYSTCNEE